MIPKRKRPQSVPLCSQCRCPMEANPYGYLCPNCSYSYSDDDAAQTMSGAEWRAWLAAGKKGL